MPFDGTHYETASPVTQMLADGRQQLQRGWCQRITRQRGSACMIGSLEITDFEIFRLAEQFILEAIDDLGYSHSSVVSFNDDLFRTKDEILEVYDRAIELSTPRLQRNWFFREALAA
jgi:hypothetical protein